MARRVLIYALVYGSIGAALGVCLALYTKDAETPHKNIILGNSNGSSAKAPSNTAVVATPIEPAQVEEN